MSTYAYLSRQRGHARNDILAEVRERTSGQLEDLHDQAAGAPESGRPAEWRALPAARAAPATVLWKHVRQVIGSLGHLEDAAPDDPDAIRVTGREVPVLAEPLRAHPHPPPG